MKIFIVLISVMSIWAFNYSLAPYVKAEGHTPGRHSENDPSNEHQYAPNKDNADNIANKHNVKGDVNVPYVVFREHGKPGKSQRILTKETEGQKGNPK